MTNNQFEKILDEAIALLQQGKSVAEITARYPEHTQELRDLLGVAEMVAETKHASQQKATFEKILRTLPSKSFYSKSMRKSPFKSFVDMLSAFADWCARPRVMKFAVVLLFLVIGTYSATFFVIKKLVIATTGGDSYSGGGLQLQSARLNSQTNERSAPPAPSAAQSEDYGLESSQSAAGNTISKRDLGLEYPQAMGLGSRDIRSSIPIIGRFLQDATVGDTREFLKTDYHTNIKTRKVLELAPRVQTIIRGYGGRVDSASVNDKSAYITFIVPKSELEAFKTELKGLVRARFITESVRQENLLPQKQVIEENTALTSDDLETLQKDRSALVSRHNATVASLQRQISALARERDVLEAEATVDPIRQAYILNRLTDIPKEQSRLRGRISAENTQYSRELNSIDNRIRNTETRLTNLEEQDQDLLDNVETVSGTVALEWIGIWETLNLYIPHLWAWLLATALALLAYRRYSRRQAVEPAERG